MMRWDAKSLIRRLVVMFAMGLTLAQALGQGQFVFGNKSLLAIPPIDAKFYEPDGVTPLAGDGYWAQAYVKLADDPESSYAPVGQAVHFRTGAAAGYIIPVVVTTPFPGGTRLNVEMRSWGAAWGGTYETALAAGGFHGKSAAVDLTVTVAPSTPPDMIGLTSLVLIPEPGSLALSLLGFATMLVSVTRPRRVVQAGRDAHGGAEGMGT